MYNVYYSLCVTLFENGDEFEQAPLWQIFSSKHILRVIPLVPILIYLCSYVERYFDYLNSCKRVVLKNHSTNNYH